MHILLALFAMIFCFGHAASTRPADAFVPPSEYALDYGAAIPSHDQIVSGDYPQGDVSTGQ